MSLGKHTWIHKVQTRPNNTEYMSLGKHTWIHKVQTRPNNTECMSLGKHMWIHKTQIGWKFVSFTIPILLTHTKTKSCDITLCIRATLSASDDATNTTVSAEMSFASSIKIHSSVLMVSSFQMVLSHYHHSLDDCGRVTLSQNTIMQFLAKFFCTVVLEKNINEYHPLSHF